jgi:hypothetical protein
VEHLSWETNRDGFDQRSFLFYVPDRMTPTGALRSGTEASHFDAGFISDFPTFGRNIQGLKD